MNIQEWVGNEEQDLEGWACMKKMSFGGTWVKLGF